MGDGADRDAGPTCDCKIGRTTREFDLDGVHDQLVARWLGDGTERASVRDLARFYNESLLAGAMTDAADYPIDGEVENLYRLLTDDVSSGTRTDARKRLERRGVDVERVESSFVSYGTVYRHLTGCLGVERSAGDGTNSVAERLETVTALKNRTAAVGEDAIADLRDAGRLDLCEFDVFVDVSVRCEACGSWLDLDDLAAHGGCQCADSA